MKECRKGGRKLDKEVYSKRKKVKDSYSIHLPQTDMIEAKYKRRLGRALFSSAAKKKKLACEKVTEGLRLSEAEGPI